MSINRDQTTDAIYFTNCLLLAYLRRHLSGWFAADHLLGNNQAASFVADFGQVQSKDRGATHASDCTHHHRHWRSDPVG